MKTQTIAGHTFTLETGQRYRASRPMAQTGMTTYPVTIKNTDGEPVANVDNLSYDEANELLNAFNDGDMSFDGRVW